MNQENFASMLEDSFSSLETKIELGASVEGTVVSIDKEVVFIDIGYKVEAQALALEFEDKDRQSTLHTGDTIMVYVASMSGQGIQVTASIGKGYTSSELLSAAFVDSLPVFGTISEEKEAGYTVTIGENRAFCPKSQFNEKEKKEAGSFYTFKILEKSGRNIVVSQKLLKKEEKARLTKELKGQLKEGDQCSAQVRRVENYGVFVQLENGLEGLVPKSELSMSKMISPMSFSLDDSINVVIKSLDWQTGKHAFSIKDTMPDPWEHISRYSVGEVYSGTVSGMIKDGAFVEIEPGLDGFIHRSRISKTKRVMKVEDFLSIGDKVEVVLDAIDPSKKRLSLELVTDEADPWKSSTVSEMSVLAAKIEKIHTSGIFIRLDNGLEAYVPKRELIKNESFLNAYQVGDSIEVIILSKDDVSRKVSASEKKVNEYKEQKEVSSYMDTQNSSSNTSSLGAMFGDLLKNIKTEVEDND